jgi:UDP-N-acetyl-D-glucosamine dehydrogenase
MEIIQNIYQEIEFALKSQQKPVKGSTIFFLGLSHKIDTENIHEPLVINLMNIALNKGADINYYDSFVNEVKLKGLVTFIEEGKEKKTVPLTVDVLESVPLNNEELGKYDCVVLTTNCIVYNEETIKEHSKTLVDIRDKIKEMSDVI